MAKNTTKAAATKEAKKPESTAPETVTQQAAAPAGEPGMPDASVTPAQGQDQGEEAATAAGEAAGAPESVRCKFRVKEKKRRCAAGGNIFTDLELEAVLPKRNAAQKVIPSENDCVWEQEPAGVVLLLQIGEDAAVFFEVGEEYILDFTRAPETPAE